jgi:opacity protein-like surface antigen
MGEIVRRLAVAAGVAALLGAAPVAAQDGQDGEDDDESAVRYDVTSDILTEAGQTTLDVGLTVQNSSDLDNQLTRQGNRNTTQIAPDVRVLYSVTEALDIEAQVTGVHAIDQQLASAQGAGSSSSDTRFSTLSAGARYLVIEEGAHPALQGFISLNLVENTADDTVYAQGGNVGVLLRKSVDPVILRSSLAYFHRPEREQGNATLDPGDNVTWRTSMDFFINDKIALTADIGLEVFEDDEFAGQSAERQRVGIPLAAGVRYTFADDMVLSLEGQVDTTNDSAQWNLRWQYLM